MCLPEKVLPEAKRICYAMEFMSLQFDKNVVSFYSQLVGEVHGLTYPERYGKLGHLFPVPVKMKRKYSKGASFQNV